MLSANNDERDALALPRGPTKRKSMLKKTIKVIGKVKPFKKNTNKTMELMNSCASFDFDAEREDYDGTSDFEQTEGDVETTEVEEDEAELERIFRKVNNIKESPDDGYDDKTDDGEVVRRGNSLHSGKGTPFTTGPSSSSKKPNQPPSDLQLESPKIARRPRIAKESSSQSPEGRESALSNSLRSSNRSATLPENVTRSPSTRSSPLPTNTKHANLDRQTLSSSQATLQRLPPRLPEAGDDIICEPLKRCSEVFSDNSAMGGYFAKLQEKVNSEANKAQSCKVQDNTGDPAKSLDEKRRRQFKPSKNIKKLLRMKRTDTESGDPKQNSSIIDPEPATRDEAAHLMLQLNTLLVANTVDREERRLKSHTTRASRSLAFDEGDDDDPTQEFPEIPTAKKTSLSEIRRMMESPVVNPSGIPLKGSRQHPSTMSNREARSFVFDQDDDPKPEDAKLARETRQSHRHSQRSASATGGDSITKAPSRTKDQSGRTHTSDKNHTSKSHQDKPHRRSSTGNHSMEVEDYDESPKSSLIMNQSPTSVAELPTNTNEKKQEETTNSPRSHKEESLRPQSSRKVGVQDMPKIALNSPHRSRRRPTSNYELGRTESDSVEIAPIKPASSQIRRSTSIRSAEASTHDSIHANDDKVNASCCLDPTASSGAPQKKRMHRRQDERRTNSDLGPQQDQCKRSSASASEVISASRQKSCDVWTEKSKNVDTSLRSSDSMTKVQPKLSLTVPKKDRQNDGDNVAAPSSTRKPLLRNSTSSPHSIPHHDERHPTSPLHQNTTMKLPCNSSQDDAERRKTKNPSLAKSLEQDKSSRSMTKNDCQYSVSTDGGSEMFVTEKNLYLKIRSDDSVAAPQLIIGANDASKGHLLVKNV